MTCLPRSILLASLKAQSQLSEARGGKHGNFWSSSFSRGGACFTWGNAAGGRLGLGSCLSDGVDSPAVRL